MMPHLANCHPAPKQQHGAATLFTSVILLMVFTLAAVYTNKNLYMEQKSATNEYRSTQAQEAAEAGFNYFAANFYSVSSSPAYWGTVLNSDKNAVATAYDFGMTNYDVKTTTSGKTQPYSYSNTASLFSNGTKFEIYLASVPGKTDRIRVLSRACSDDCTTVATVTRDVIFTYVAAAAGLPSVLYVNDNIINKSDSSIHAYYGNSGSNVIDNSTIGAVQYGGSIVRDGGSQPNDIGGKNIDGSAYNNPADVGTLTDDNFFAKHFGTTNRASIQSKGTTKSTLNSAALGTGDQLVVVNSNVTTSSSDWQSAAWQSAPDANGNSQLVGIGSGNTNAIVIINGDLTINGPVAYITAGMLYVTGNVTINGTVDFYGTLAVEGNLTVNGSFGLRPMTDPSRLLNKYGGGGSGGTLTANNTTNNSWRDF